MNLSSLQIRLPGVLVLELAGVDSEGAPLVRLAEGDDPQPVHVVWMRNPPDWSACTGKRAVVATRDGGAPPILLGLLDPPPTETEQHPPEKLHIGSEEELIIECGKAKISMRADGRIEIRGGHLISRSSGPNKIKGRSVHIN